MRANARQLSSPNPREHVADDVRTRLDGERPSSRLPPGWRRWIAENKMLGIGDAQIIGSLQERGVSADRCRREIEDLSRSPAFRAGRTIGQRLKKLESLLAVHGALARLSFAHDVVERRSHVSAEEFRERYYCRNRPVVLTDLFEQMPALARWTPDYLQQACGDTTVEIMAGRETDRDYEVNCADHKTTMRFGDYVDLVRQVPESNDAYLVANNGFFDRPDTEALRRDLLPIPPYLDGESISGRVFLWFGPGGTVTPLHHDVMNVLFAQVQGHKTFALIPSWELPNVYNHLGVYSEVDLEAPDEKRFPRFRQVQPLMVTLGPGELLFLPVGWFHHVRALDVSIGISFTNFRDANAYEWAHPDIVR